MKIVRSTNDKKPGMQRFALMPVQLTEEEFVFLSSVSKKDKGVYIGTSMVSKSVISSLARLGLIRECASMATITEIGSGLLTIFPYFEFIQTGICRNCSAPAKESTERDRIHVLYKDIERKCPTCGSHYFLPI